MWHEADIYVTSVTGYYWHTPHSKLKPLEDEHEQVWLFRMCSSSFDSNGVPIAETPQVLGDRI